MTLDTFHNHAQELTSRGHQEILSSIAALASPMAMASRAATCYRVIPHLANPALFGRDAELERLVEVLVPNRKSRLQIFSIVGESGIGKTQLALQFVYDHFSEFSAIFWLPADSSVKLAQAYQDVTVELGLIQASGDHTSLSTIREAIKKWLRTTGNIATNHGWV